MALGRKPEVIDTSNAQDIAAMAEENDSSQFGTYGSDPEKQADPLRKMSRVGGALNTDSDIDSTLSVGKQIELEQTQSIKYRTCSWQKVVLFHSDCSCLECATSLGGGLYRKIN